jgi:hypothetical protein
VQHLEEVVVVFVHGQGEDGRIRVHLLYAPGGLDPVHVGHLHVHQNHVRLQGAHFLDGFPAVFGLADDLDVLARLQQHAQPGTDDDVIISQQQT